MDFRELFGLEDWLLGKKQSVRFWKWFGSRCGFGNFVYFVHFLWWAICVV